MIRTYRTVQIKLMNILLLTPDYPPPPGGIQTFTQNIEHGLKKLGHNIDVVEAPNDLIWRDYYPSSDYFELGFEEIIKYWKYKNVKRIFKEK